MAGVAKVKVTGGRLVPDAVRHLNVFVPVDLAGQLKFTIKAFCCEQTLQESVEQTLIKLVVHSSPVDGLGHQGLQCGPGDLIWRDVLPPLCEEGWGLWGQVGGAPAQPGVLKGRFLPHPYDRRDSPPSATPTSNSRRPPPVCGPAACTCLCRVVQPRVHRVAGRTQVRLPKFVLLRPPQGCITQAFLDDRMEPGQQEVQASALVGRLDEEG